MPARDNDIYALAPLGQYTLRQRLLIRAADVAFYLAIKIIGSTLRYEMRGRHHYDAIVEAGRLPIYTFWHNHIFAGAYFFRDRGIAIMTSQSFDGEYIARFIRRLGYGSVRGSSSRGGSRALISLIRAARSGIPAGFAVDGPRGPRHVAQPGPIYLARQTGNPVMPFTVQAENYWQLRSWDRMQIPHPFSKVVVTIGPPIYVNENDDITVRLRELQSSLDQLTDAG